MPSDYVPIKTFIKCDLLLVQLLYPGKNVRYIHADLFYLVNLSNPI